MVSKPSRMSAWRTSGGVSMSVVPLPWMTTPVQPRRLEGSRRASSHAGQWQKNAGTPQPELVPRKVSTWRAGTDLNGTGPQVPSMGHMSQSVRYLGSMSSQPQRTNPSAS